MSSRTPQRRTAAKRTSAAAREASNRRVEAGDQAEGAAQIATDIGGVHARARAGREHEASLGPLLPRREPVLCLPHPLGAKGVDAQPGQGDGAA